FYTYSGNYSYYLQKKAEAEESAASSQRKFKGVLRKELEWLKKGPKARSTKQKARIDRIREMQGTEFKQAQGKVDISTVGRRIGKKVIEVNNISKSYGDRTLFKDFTYEFSPEDRVGIIGENGAGKSTLINIITGKEQPDKGEVDIGSTVYIGYFDQHSEELIGAGNDSQRVIDYIKQEGGELIQTTDGSTITASQMLERFLFPPNQQYAPINKLSGGEKRRLFLLRILMSAPNVLILDEPTNDLDVQTLAVLEDYLEDFKGCVIVVSHDRYFLDRTIDRIFAFEDKKIREFPGNYSVYLDFKRAEEAKEKQKQAELEKSKPKVETQKVETQAKKEDNKKKRRLSNWERKEFEQLEGKIAELEDEKTETEMALTKAAGDYSQVQELYEKVEKLKEEIEKSTERWMELAEIDG
ncbi:MAG: ATP-binding cassette domain-containing protein, partial [Cyanobacteriota bacterium]|nr:ATP-binding cassette domain-containing protein [Cyanobacteriota bacterium]